MIYIAAINESSKLDIDGPENVVISFTNTGNTIVYKADTPEDTTTIEFKTESGLSVFVTLTSDIIHNLNSINLKSV